MLTKFKMRFRYVYMILGSILVLGLWMLSDPDAGIIEHLPFGGSTLATLIFLSKAVLYGAMLHITRKGLMDYKEADLQLAMRRALGSPSGAGMVVIGIGLICIAIAILILAAVSN